jgi:hypothetical protein
VYRLGRPRGSSMPTFAHRKIRIKALPTRFRTEEATVGLGLKNHPRGGGGGGGRGGMAW